MDARMDEIDEEDLDPDLLISEEEQKAFEEFIKLKKQQLEDTQRRYKKWLTSFTRRRMIAFTKLKKLERNSKTRLQFYDRIKTLNEQGQNNTTDQNSSQTTKVNVVGTDLLQGNGVDTRGDNSQSTPSIEILHRRPTLEILEENEETFIEETAENLDDNFKIQSLNESVSDNT